MRFLVLITALLSIRAEADVDFNRCKSSAVTQRLECLRDAAAEYDRSIQEIEPVDGLSPRFFNANERSSAFTFDLSFKDGMHLDDPNDIHSGQYFATVVDLRVGYLTRHEDGISFDMPYSRFASTGASAEGVKRLGRPGFGITRAFIKNDGARLTGYAEIKVPLVSGSSISQVDHVWGAELGLRGARSLGSWNVNGRLGFHYDGENTRSYSVPSGGITWSAGTLYQNPVLLKADFGFGRSFSSSALDLGIFSVYSLNTARSITMNDPSAPSLHFVHDDPMIQLISLKLGYAYAVSSNVSLTFSFWRSLLNANVDQAIRSDLDDPSISAAYGLSVALQTAF